MFRKALNTGVVVATFIASGFFGAQVLYAQSGLVGGFFGAQFGDTPPGSCPAGQGPYTTTPGSGSWTGWFGDSDSYDPDCMKIGQGNVTIPVEKDIRLCGQAIDYSWWSPGTGSEVCTPWASQGGGIGGYITDNDGWDPDSYQFKIEVQDWPGHQITDTSVSFELSDVASGGGCGQQSSGFVQTPSRSAGGGQTGWLLDTDGQNFNCIRLALNVVSVAYTLPPAAPTPAGLTASCNTSGVATLNWGAVAGATDYYVGVTGAAPYTCYPGWTQSGNTCYRAGINYNQVVPQLPTSATYNWYVYAHNSDGYSAPTTGPTFVCPNPTADVGISSIVFSPSNVVTPGTKVYFYATSTNYGTDTLYNVSNQFYFYSGGGLSAQRFGIFFPAQSLEVSSFFTFNTPGTYYVAVCTDSTGSIVESNESNNCTAWLPGTVTVAYASCVQDGVTVPSGSSYTFYNTNMVPNGQSCSNAAYSLSRLCTNGTLGGNSSFNRASCSTAPLQSAVSLSANGTSTAITIRKGTYATILWDGGNADNCTISSNPAGFSWSGVTGNQHVLINQKTIFTATCGIGSLSSKSTTMTINIVPTIIEQ